MNIEIHDSVIEIIWAFLGCALFFTVIFVIGTFLKIQALAGIGFMLSFTFWICFAVSFISGVMD